MASSTNTARLIIRKRAAPNFLAKKVKSESNITSPNEPNASTDSVSVLSESNNEASKITEEFPIKKLDEINNKELIYPSKPESDNSLEATSDVDNLNITSSTDTQPKLSFTTSESIDSQSDNLNELQPDVSSSLLTVDKVLDNDKSKILDSSKSDNESTSLELKTLKKRCAPILPKKRQLPNIKLSSQTISNKSDTPSVHCQREDAKMLNDKILCPLVTSHTNLTTNEIKEVDNINDDTISAKKNIENQDSLSNQELSVDSVSNENSNILIDEKISNPQIKKLSSKALLTKRALPVLPRKRPAPNLSSQAKNNLVNPSKENSCLKINETVSDALLSEGPQLKQLKVAIKESLEKNFNNTIDSNAQPSEVCLSVQNQKSFQEEKNKTDCVDIVSSFIAPEKSQSVNIKENNCLKSKDQNDNQEINKDVKNTVQKFLKKRVGPKLVSKNSSKVPKISTNDKSKNNEPLISPQLQDVLEKSSDMTLDDISPKEIDDSNKELSSESEKKGEGEQNNFKDIVKDKLLQIQNEKMDAILEPKATRELDTSALEDVTLNKDQCDVNSEILHISSDGHPDSLGQKNLTGELLPSKTSGFSEKLSNVTNNELGNLTLHEESEEATRLCNDEDQENMSQPCTGSTLVVTSESDISKKPYKLRLQQPVKNTVENLELSDDEIVEDIFSNSENSDDSEYTAELDNPTSKLKIEKSKHFKKKTVKKRNCIKGGAKKERKPRKKIDATNKEGKVKAEKKVRKACVENPSAFMKLGMEVKNKNKWDEKGNCAEPEKLELKDFIFFVPKNEPMSQDMKKETKVNGGEDKEEEMNDGKEEDEVEESHGPKLIVKDGKIMVDPNSTKIKQTPVVHAKIEKIEKPKEPNDPWELLDTMKFYGTLWKYGIDFSMLAGTFPKKSRDSIKKKFNFEEKNNNLLLSKTLTKKLDIKAVLRELILIDSLEKVTRKKPGSNKPPKEPRKAKKHCLLHKKKIVRNNENKTNNIDLISYNGDASNQSMSSCISDNEISMGEGMNLINLKDVITFSTNVVYKDMNIIESVSFHPSAIQPVDVNVTIRHDPEEASPLQPQLVTQDTSLK